MKNSLPLIIAKELKRSERKIFNMYLLFICNVMFYSRVGPWSPSDGRSTRATCHMTRNSADSCSEPGLASSTKRLGELNLLSAPPQYRARSPSPLSGPAHHHLVMEAAEAKILSNNNTEAPDTASADRQVPPAPIPLQCSTQLAKVLEKQIEVIHRGIGLDLQMGLTDGKSGSNNGKGWDKQL